MSGKRANLYSNMSYRLGCDAAWFGRQVTDVSDECAASNFSLDVSNLYGHRCDRIKLRVISVMSQRLKYKYRRIIAAVWNSASAY